MVQKEDWRKYSDETAKLGEPRISIRSNGQICFLQSTIRQYNVDEYDYAVLWFAEAKKQIGIELTNEEQDGAFEILYNASGEYTIAVSKFLSIHDVPYDKTCQFDIIRFIHNKNMMIVDLLSGEDFKVH